MAEDWVDIPKTAETADSSDWTDIPAAPTVLSRYRQTMTKAVKSGDPDQPAGTDAEQPNINYFPRPSTEGQTWMAAPNLEETQLNEQKLPEGVALNENKKPYNVNTGQELKVIPRPAAVPFIKTPEGDIQWSGSKLTDVISNLLPSPALKVAPKVAQVADRIYLPTAPVAEGLPIPEARGKGARLLPPETPHEPIALPEAPALPPRAGVGAEAAVGPLDGVSPEAINQVASDLKEAHFTPYTLDDKLEKMSPHQFLAEADENLETEAGKIAAMGGEARNTIVQNFDQRHSEVKQRLKSSYDSAFGPVENLAQERKTLTIDQQAAAAEFYKKFRNLEIYPTDELKEIMPRLQAADAFGEAKKIAAVEGFPWEESFFTTGTRKNYPTAESWDYVKRALDTKIEGSFNQFGEPTNWTRIYTNLKNKLVGAIDNHPNPEVAGVWKEARDAYAGPAKIKNSYDLGKKILSDAVDANEVPFLTASHSTKELEAIAQGIRYNLENQLGKAGPQEGRSIRQMISDNAQNKIRWIIGDEKAEKLFNSIDLENQMYGAPTRIYGGAATSKRVLGAVERYGPKPPPGAEALGTIVETGVNLLKEPKKTVTKTVSKFVTEKMARAAEEKAAKLRADIAHIYTLQGPERDVALRWILEHGEGFKGTPTRATGGSVFDKMHAAKHMAEGGGTDAPFNEWDAVPRNAEGIPQIRIEKPPVNEADEAQAAREAAAARVAGNVRGAPYEPTPPSTEGKTWMMEPGKEAVQSGNYENTLPPNVRLNDAGIPYNVETGEELQMARRPNVLPLTRTPDGVQWAVPKIAELAGDIVNPLAVTKGVALNPGEFALGSGPIRAYHGSPHDFDKFDLAKIGTGEGAQSYGHGLYFAENPKVAQDYRDALAPGFRPTLNGVPFSALSSGEQKVAQWIANTGAKPEDIAKIARDRAAKAMADGNAAGMGDLGDILASSHNDIASAAENLIGKPAEIGRAPNGRMYEVNINADPNHFLDWDKPLSKQAPQAQDAFKQLGFEPNPNKYPSMKEAENLFGSYRVQKLAYDDIGTRESLKRGLDLVRAGDKTGFQNWFDHSGGMLSPGRHKDIRGKDLYYELGNKAGMADPSAAFKARYPQASAQLNEVGIPGIKYLDQGSRAAGDGSRNYVVFDPKIIEIMKKYGMTLPAATAAYEAMKTDQEKTGFKKGGSVFDKMKRASK